MNAAAASKVPPAKQSVILVILWTQLNGRGSRAMLLHLKCNGPRKNICEPFHFRAPSILGMRLAGVMSHSPA